MTPKIEVTVQGHNRSIQIDAIVDTGFSGAFFLPMDVATWVDAEVAGWGEVLLADGSVKKIVTAFCVVEVLDRARRVQAFVADTPEPLIGMELLDRCELTIDIESGDVKLKRKRT